MRAIVMIATIMAGMTLRGAIALRTIAGFAPARPDPLPQDAIMRFVVGCSGSSESCPVDVQCKSWLARERQPMSCPAPGATGQGIQCRYGARLC